MNQGDASQKSGIQVLAFLLCCAFTAQAAKLDPVHWTLTSESDKAPPGSSIVLKLSASLDEGWHLYSLTTPKGGPIPTTIGLLDNPAVAGFKLYQPKPERKFDPNFNLDTETFQKEAIFWIVADLKKDAPPGPLEISAWVRYQSCDDRQCLPPKKKTAVLTLTLDPSAPTLLGSFGRMITPKSRPARLLLLLRFPRPKPKTAWRLFC